MLMLNRSTNTWPCVWLFCAACTLDSSPRFPSTDDEGRAKDGHGEWKPAGADSEPRASAATQAAKDAEATEDAAMPATAANPSRPTNNMGDTAKMARATPADMMMAAAGSGVAAMPSTAAAGSGGVEPAQAGAAGSAGSAGAESDDLRQRLIDATTGLSPELVMGVLFSMRASGQCFRDVRRCVETCVVIAQDCKACAEDAECAAAFKEVCGETLGTCRTP